MMYVYRSLEVQAVQWTGGNMAEVQAYLAPHDGPWNPQGANAACPLSVWTALGPHAVGVGQWLVHDEVRGMQVIDNALFSRLVEAVESDGTGVSTPVVVGEPGLGKAEDPEPSARAEDGWDEALAVIATSKTPKRRKS